MSEIELADVVFVVGLGLVGAGCWGLWGWAAAALVVGVVLLAVAGLAARMGRGDG